MNTYLRFRLGVAILACLLLLGSASATHFAYITNFGSNNVSIIDTNTDIVVNAIPVGNGPWGVAVNAAGNPAQTRVYVTNTWEPNISVIGPHFGPVTNVTVGFGPDGVVVTSDGDRVYVANAFSENVSIIDTATNTVVTSVNVGSTPRGVAVNPTGTRVYVVCGPDEHVWVIDSSTNSINTTIPVGKDSVGIAVNPIGTRIYVTNKFEGTVSVFDTTTFPYTDTATISVGLDPMGVAVTPDGSKVYVANHGSNNISVIDTSTNLVTSSIDVGAKPMGVAVTPDGSKVYVANFGSNNVSVINTTTDMVIASVDVGIEPIAFGQFIGPDMVTNNPPVADAGLDQTVIVNENVQFDGSGSTDVDGTIVSYTWYFGDANSDTAMAPTHAYIASGTYAVTLTVTDDDGATDSDNAIITVKTPQEATQDLILKAKESKLPPNIEKETKDMLVASKNKIDEGKYDAAQRTLEAFIKLVDSQRDKTISSAEADELIKEANRIITSIPKRS